MNLKSIMHTLKINFAIYSPFRSLTLTGNCDFNLNLRKFIINYR